MLKINIKNKQGLLGWSASFETQEEADNWIASQIENNCWGKSERWVKESDEDVSQALETRNVQVLENSITEYKLAAEYTIEQEDITAQLTQEQTNKEALQYLADTDWYIIREMDEGTPCPSDIKIERAAARARIVR